MERNTLMAKCYPRIKDYCREKHGLEFQVNNFDAPIKCSRSYLLVYLKDSNLLRMLKKIRI